MSAHAPAHAPAHGHHRNYVKIWAVLVALLMVSVIGPMFGIRVVTLITAFGIALVKAYMVAKNFMHLDIEKPIVGWMLAVALTFMVLMFSGIAPDVMKSKGRSWEKGPGFHPVEKVGHGDAGHGAAGSTHGGTGDAHGAAGSGTTGHGGGVGAAAGGADSSGGSSGH